MIRFECLWCDQPVTLSPEALAVGSITCPACLTQVDLAVGPAAHSQPQRATGGQSDLRLAA